MNLGLVSFRREQWQEAYDRESKALAIQERALPPDYFDLGYTAGNVCDALIPLRRYREALAMCQRAHDILARAFGPDSPELADSLAHLAAARLGLGDAHGALAPAERAMAMSSADDAVEVAERQFILARVLAELHQDPKRALSLASQARAAYATASAHHVQALADIDAWLAHAAK